LNDYVIESRLREEKSDTVISERSDQKERIVDAVVDRARFRRCGACRQIAADHNARAAACVVIAREVLICGGILIGAVLRRFRMLRTIAGFEQKRTCWRPPEWPPKAAKWRL